jgi:hypothetical protein
MADEVSIEELRADLEAVLRRVAGDEQGERLKRFYGDE